VFIASVMFVGNVITTFGTDTLLIREIARTHTTDTPALPSSFWIQIVLSVLFIGIIVVWTGFLPSKTPGTLLGLRLYSLSLLPLAFFSVYSAILRAYERMDLCLVTTLFSAILQVGGAWLVLRGGDELLPLLLWLLGIQVCAALLAGLLCYKYIPGFALRWRVTLPKTIKVLRTVWPLALISIFAIFYQRMGTLMLSLLGGDAPTGWFSAAARIVDAAKIAHFAVLGALLPALSNLQPSTDGRHAEQALFRRSLLLLSIFAIIMAVGIALFCRPLVLFLYGTAYAPTAPALQVLALSLIPYTLSANLSLRLIVQGRERRVLQATAISLAASAALYLWLIKSLGLMGASLAAVCSESLQALIFLL
jgi:O-antigen/teichoic acid export membrane protein